MRIPLVLMAILLAMTHSAMAGPAHCDKEAGRGIASWYGPGFQGALTKNEEVFDAQSYSAAHTTLPFGTLLKVINLRNNRSVYVRVNDRGAFGKTRLIDLSEAAARQIDMIADGTAAVALYRCDTPVN